MKVNPDNLRFIFGKKLKQIRHQKGLLLKELADKTNLSASYLSEIEKGKKYPKPEKLMVLAEALDIPYDNLVSLEIGENLNPLKDIMDSPFVKEFPFELFGISSHDIFNLVTEYPEKARAFIRTIWEIGQIYDMRIEHFLFAALRSYQKMNLNYFPDLEESATSFARERKLSGIPTKEYKTFIEILTTDYNYRIDEKSICEHPELMGFRSVFVEGKNPTLLVNPNLLPSQKAFILGREIGYNYLKLKERAKTSSWLKVESFEQVFNNFKASYFSGALLINKESLKKDFRTFFNQKKWNGKLFINVMKKYGTTPEMFIYRLGHIIPKFFGLEEVHYLRFNNKLGTDDFKLTKELNMFTEIAPHSIGLNEHFCRRWLSIKLLQQLNQKQKNKPFKNLLIDAQRAKFIERDVEFFTIALARPLALSSDTNSSMTMGFLMNDKFKRTVKFWDDDRIPRQEVNDTCERCSLLPDECNERVAQPEIYELKKFQDIREQTLEKLINNIRSN